MARKPPEPRPRIGGRPGGGCFAAETIVSTPSGPRNIETLKPGDMVTTANGAKAIVEVRQHYRDGLVLMDFGDGDPICCSAEHPFLESNGDLVEAQFSETMNGFLVNANGEELTASVIQIDDSSDVYEIILESEDSIFVGANKVASKPTKEM